MKSLLHVVLMAPAGEGQSPYMSFVFLLLIIVVFYFFMIRPQVRKQKELRTYREGLQKGDKIVTSGGIYGKIVDVKENVVLVEVADNIRLRIDKSAVLKDSSDLAGRK
ncbi:MAG: preprotein translocase subunit YajC [Bacteroidales bacterium]|nr:MAG: preprotein translocase subunit YajC [Bacteroidales bacterium]